MEGERVQLIQSIRVKNFQSLHDVQLEFGKFTVIVGASSSGKSALTRAIKAVASNSLDSDYITKGSKHSSVSLYTDNQIITIERESGGTSAYKVTNSRGEEQSFTKLNRQVPAQVTAALGITPGTKEVESIHFAGQFDTPYLLKDGASNVARVLGELTNVSTIFEAVRESSKRAKAASGVLNLRKKDQEKLLTQISDYANVGTEAKAVTKAEQLLTECNQLQQQIAALTALSQQLTTASEARQAIKNIPELPDLDPLLEAHKKLDTFKTIVRQLVHSRDLLNKSQTSIVEADAAIILAEEELHNTLVAAGECPTCNQKVH
jgi:DNA repair ATPase RecN